MPDKEERKPKPELHVAKSDDVEGLAKVFERLTGQPLSPEDLARLRAIKERYQGPSAG